MAVSEPSSGGLAASLKHLGVHLGEAAVLRGRLASLELARERQRGFTLLAWFSAGAFFSVMAVLMATFFVVTLFWESHRFIAMGCFFVAFVLIAGGAFWRLLYLLRNMPPVMDETLRVLEKDYQCLANPEDPTVES